MHLVYLKEGRKYGVEELRKCIRDQLNSSDGGSVWPDSSDVAVRFFTDDKPDADIVQFFERFRGSLNGIKKAIPGDGKTVARKLRDGRYVFRYVGLYDYVDIGEESDSDKRTGLNLTFFFLPKFIDFNEKTDCSGVIPDDGDEDENDLNKGDTSSTDNVALWIKRVNHFASSGHKERNAVLQAIDRYNKELNRLGNPVGETKQHEGLLELAVRVLRDYLENGVYTVQQRELEHNGQGEIDWEMTIDQYQPVLLKGRPYYMDYSTELANSDEDHYITRLHQCLVTTWGRKLEELGLSSVLRVNVPLLSEEELYHFGPKEHQLDRIRKELGVQFVTKSRNTLVLMKELIEGMSESQSANDLSLSFGMNGAEHLWEAACAAVLGSELDETISDCGLDWTQEITFRAYMPRPIWKQIGQKSPESTDENAYDLENKKSGWRLDFIRTLKSDKGDVEKLVILDAKYYDVSWSDDHKTIFRQPGIGDIAKQIFYQKAFEDLLLTEPGVGFVNAFLFPMDDGISTEIACGETVHLGWTSPSGEAVSFSDVELFTVYIPGIELLKKYASNEIADDWFEKIATRTLRPRWCEGEASPA